MSFTINGRDTAGNLTLKRDTAPAAIKKAMELVSEGVREVKICNPDGRIFDQDTFSELYVLEMS